MTRERLVEVAAELFGERGYEATSVEAVLQQAGVSRGSLYHHFASKGALFAAVVEAVETRVGADVSSAAVDATGALEILRAGAREWIRLAGDPLVQRILLIDAPSVLGWEQWRQVEERHAFGLTKSVLEAASAEGLIHPERVDVMAHMLLAAVSEIAQLVARASDPEAEMRIGSEAVDDLLRAMFSANAG